MGVVEPMRCSSHDQANCMKGNSENWRFVRLLKKVSGSDI